jgi:virginiamycin B lyase
MRHVFVCSVLFLIPVLAAAPAGRVEKRKQPVLPKLGIKTPGVQVPFEKLKSEADIALNGLAPGFVFSDAVYVQQGDGIAKIDLKTNKPGDAIGGLKQPCVGLLSAFGSLWSADCGSRSLVRIDAKTSKVAATLSIGAATGALRGLAATADSVWMLSDDKVTLSRIDPDTNRVVAELRLPAKCGSLAYGENSLWVSCTADNKVLRVNPQTNLVTKTIEVSLGPRSLVFGEGAVWVLCETDGKVARIDPKTDKVAATVDLGVPKAAGDITAGGGSIWVTLTGFPLTRIDPGIDKVVQQFHGEGASAIHFGSGSLWLTNLQKTSLARIDPKRVAATFAE